MDVSGVHAIRFAGSADGCDQHPSCWLTELCRVKSSEIEVSTVLNSKSDKCYVHSRRTHLPSLQPDLPISHVSLTTPQVYIVMFRSCPGPSASPFFKLVPSILLLAIVTTLIHPSRDEHPANGTGQSWPAKHRPLAQTEATTLPKVSHVW